MASENKDYNEYMTILGHRFWMCGVDCFGIKRTGLSRDILICTRQPDIPPLIIVCKENSDNTLCFCDRAQAFVSIGDNPTVIVSDSTQFPKGVWSQIVEWIRLNKDALLKYWQEDIDTADFIKAMRKTTMNT